MHTRSVRRTDVHDKPRHTNVETSARSILLTRRGSQPYSPTSTWLPRSQISICAPTNSIRSKVRWAGFWSVRVSRNWRIIFRFEQGDAYDVNLVDYH